ncbi:MAG: ribonuclease III [Parcubacteria group bacterium Licking1014_17]|nr:MAG: ribonuclease III [Parcubacteria group bacterium Licking1014_17]
MENNISQLEKSLGYSFKNKDLLLQAVTHRSYLNENPDWRLPHNERLEFLGDAALELVVTEYLYENFPNPEGELTSWRSALVNADMLSVISSKFDLNSHILLSRGEAKDSGRARQYILANAMEAVIGAVYLDGGYEATKVFISRYLLPELTTVLKEKSYKDPKSSLQEEAQERTGITPSYEVLENWGPDHMKQFRIGVYLNKELIGEGVGSSKQEAQQAAAEDALMKKSW